ncbi:unnamed protein product, partial [Scytosiphon promiscuus]
PESKHFDRARGRQIRPCSRQVHSQVLTSHRFLSSPFQKPQPPHPGFPRETIVEHESSTLDRVQETRKNDRATPAFSDGLDSYMQNKSRRVLGYIDEHSNSNMRFDRACRRNCRL